MCLRREAIVESLADELVEVVALPRVDELHELLSTDRDMFRVSLGLGMELSCGLIGGGGFVVLHDRHTIGAKETRLHFVRLCARNSIRFLTVPRAETVQGETKMPEPGR
jgi:hypothetical protein